MRFGLHMIAATSLGALALACGGSSSYSAPTAPSPSAGTSSPNAVTITITSVNGARSFSPNPASVPAGQTVIWYNADTITHHVVLNDGSVDTGNLAPGASSGPMQLSSNGANYHCSIHPSMVGSVNGATTDTPPPCTGAYC